MTSYEAKCWGTGHDMDSGGKGQDNQLWGRMLGDRSDSNGPASGIAGISCGAQHKSCCTALDSSPAPCHSLCQQPGALPAL